MSSPCSGLCTWVDFGHVQEMQSLTECGLTRVPRLIQACDVTRRDGEQDRILVYLIKRLRGKQVLTGTNLFCMSETEDKLEVSADVCVKHFLSKAMCTC